MKGRGELSVLVAAFIFWRSAVSHRHNFIDDKIVGGSAVDDIRLAPHATSLQLQLPSSKEWQKFCGGSIFSPLYVITACHCVTKVDSDSGQVVPLANYIPMKFWRFVAGTVHLVRLSATSQIRTPQSLRHHPKCERTTGNESWLVFDAAVAKMAEPFNIGEFVKPVKIFSLDRENFEAHLDELILNRRQPPNCQLAGWGSTKQQSLLNFFLEAMFSTTEPTNNNRSEQTEDENQMKIVRLTPMYEGECLVRLTTALTSVFGIVNLQTVQNYGKLLHQQICALGIHSPDSVCRGDSGSGLLCDGYLVGVTSWGLGCGTEVPDVFQGISVVIDWFSNQVCSIQACSDVEHFPRLCIRTKQDERTLGNYSERCSNKPLNNRTETDQEEVKLSSRIQDIIQETTEGFGTHPKNFSMKRFLPTLVLHLLTTLSMTIHLTLKLFPFEEYIVYVTCRRKKKFKK